jgi:uncharacterized protein
MQLESSISQESPKSEAFSGGTIDLQKDFEAFHPWFVARYPSIPPKGAFVVLKLVAEGGTVPFIARYRKDMTGNLDEVAIARIIEASDIWTALVKRKAFVLKEIQEQGKLTPELRVAIELCGDPDRLEDYYLPFKRKRKTKAAIAREAGLEPFANWIWEVGHGAKPDQPLAEFVTTFISAEKGVVDAQSAIDGARHIIIERLVENPELRQYVRESVFSNGGMVSMLGEKKDEEGKFEQYVNYEESISSLLKPNNSHRYLAARRGESEKILMLKVGAISSDSTLEDRLIDRFQQEAVVGGVPVEIKEILVKAARFALKLHVMPSIETEVHRTLKDAADEVAIGVFSENVRKILLGAPLGSKMVLGVDPGLRTGCKLALVDASGKFLAHSVLHTERESDRQQCLELLKKMATTGSLGAIAVGNGTGGREAEKFFRELVKEAGLSTHVVSVNEAGASVYSASAVAREEFPDLDITVRGAISIARRLQDPLAELVKIDPKSIGVGQYQHDVSQTGLKKSLERVVESCVNAIGVNLNTASEHLLAYVAGVGASLAKGIVGYRNEKGLFHSKEDLKNVPRFGSKAYEQAAGFVRVPESPNPLDNTGVHPESYAALVEYAAEQGARIEDFIGAGASRLRNAQSLKEKIGELALEDIIGDLEKPGRDPRENFVPFAFMDGVEAVKDLKVGMRCPGIVTNVTNFGAFVDIGVHQDGLVHISQLSDTFIKDPQLVVSPGDKVSVLVTEVDVERKRIALSMRSDAVKNLGSSGAQQGASSGTGGSQRDNSRRSDKASAGGSSGKGQLSTASARSNTPQRSDRKEASPQSQSSGNERSGNNQRSNNAQRSGGGNRDSYQKGGGKQDSFSNTPFAALKGLSIKTNR